MYTPGMRFHTLMICALSTLVALAGCSSLAPRPTQQIAQPGKVQVVRASHYGGKDWDGRVTASGERFDSSRLTAAHRTLPFGSKLKVTNPRNGKSTIVTVNDRGPYTRGRALDLSLRAAQELDLTAEGVSEVQIEFVDETQTNS